MSLATAHYNEHYYGSLVRELLQDPEYYRTKAHCAARLYFGSFPRPYGRILEFGCGLGQNIADLEDAVGYDVSPEAIQRCRERDIAVIPCEQDIPRGRFRYVLCRHVLEHVESPLAVLRQLFSYLSEDGRLILVLPKEGHRRVPLAPDIHRHLYCWNFRAINNLIALAGGQAVQNWYEPMFGPRTYRLLRPVLRLAGLSTYYHLGRLVGRLLRQTEIVIHARPQPAAPGVAT